MTDQPEKGKLDKTPNALIATERGISKKIVGRKGEERKARGHKDSQAPE